MSETKENVPKARILLVKENRRSFTIKEESVKIPSLIATLRAPKEGLSDRNIMILRDLADNPYARDCYTDSIIKRLNKGLSLCIFVRRLKLNV